MQGHADGFTIIEVTIFLAISGLLLLGMFLGTGAMAAQQRFKDTTDNLQTFLQSQYDEVVNGVNVRNTSTACDASSTNPGKSQCLLLGKLLTIYNNGSTIQAAYVVSTQKLTGNETTDQQKLQNAGLKVVSDGQTTYELKWGAVFSEATRAKSDGTREYVNSVAFVRLPDSSRIVQLYYRNPDYAYPTAGLAGTGATPGTGVKDSAAYSPLADATGASFVVCIKNDLDFASFRTRSAILFAQGQGAGTITANYSPGDVVCAF